MWKEMPVIPVDRVVDKKKREGRGGDEAQGVADSKKDPHRKRVTVKSYLQFI
jgi:hypothetical protein